MTIIKSFALLSFSLISLSTFAIGLPKIKIQKLEGRYSSPSGSATAKYWQVPNLAPISDASFTVFQEQDLFVFEGDAGLFELKGLPESIVKMNSLNWKDASFTSNNTGLNLSLKSLTGSDDGGLLLIKNLNFKCNGSSNEVEVRDATFDVCLRSSSIKSSLFDIYESARANTRTVLENFNMNISNGDFKLNVRAKFDITANIKANGKITYIKRSEGAELRIRLDKAKASFLNVTKKVFEAIEDQATSGVRVERPYIIIDLDQ